MYDDRYLIDDEVLIIENGGEMPEVAMHGCLYFLSHDPEGPCRELTAGETWRLKLAVVEGYRRIIVRDLTLENRGQGHYRGLARCLVNWRRLRRFCQREGIAPAPLAAEFHERFKEFVLAECEEFLVSRRPSGAINCSVRELLIFCQQVNLDPALLPEGWPRLAIPGH